MPKDIKHFNDRTKMFVLEDINDIYLAVHIPQQGMTGEKNYTQLDNMMTLANVFKTKNTLFNDEFTKR
jgi:hypothetical protein